MTSEQQLRMHAENPRGLFRVTDQLVDSFDFGAYKKNGSGDRAKMLRLWDGGPMDSDRVGSGNLWAENAMMSLLAGTQPEKLKTLVRDLGSDGLLQRMNFIMDDGAIRDEYDEEAQPEPDYEAAAEYEVALRALASIDYEKRYVVRLSPGAREVLKAFKRDYKRLEHIPGASDAWTGHLNKTKRSFTGSCLRSMPSSYAQRLTGFCQVLRCRARRPRWA